MIQKHNKQSIYLTLFFIILLIPQLGCSTIDSNNDQLSKRRSNPNQLDEKAKVNYVSDDLPQFVAGYSPLTFEKYTSLRNNTDSFSLVHIAYRNDSNYDQGIARDYIWMGLSGGLYNKSFVFSSIENYKGSLHKDIEGISSPNGDDFFSSFSPELVESIFAYIESNQDYYFNGEEYNGMTPPVDSEGQYLIMEDNMFYLSFTEPDDYYYAWAIHKCMDVPDPILQGLIDILNDEFISQFE